MPKLKENQVPSYRLHKQSGQAIVSLSGRDHVLGKFDSKESREKYDRLIGEWLSNGRRSDYRNADGVTVSRVIAEFWAHAKSYYVGPGGEVRGSEADNFRVALLPLKRLYGGTAAAEIGPRSLMAIQQEMVRMGWCRTHVNRQIARIKQVFKWAAAQEMVPGSVYSALTAVSGLRKGKSAAAESGPVRPVPEAFVYPLKDHVARQVWAMIELQLFTGMRAGEVVIMRGCDLERGETVWTYRPHRHKTQHHDIDREVRIGPKARRLLKPLLKLDLQAHLFSPADAERERREALRAARKTPLNCGNVMGSNRLARPSRLPGARYTVRSYRRAIERGCDDAFPPPAELARRRVPAEGRKKKSTRWETPAEWKARLGDRWAEVVKWREEHRWHPHQLRHTAATRLRREYGIEAARIILGHQSAAITQIYAEADLEKATKIMGEVG
jgi:integrase